MSPPGAPPSAKCDGSSRPGKHLSLVVRSVLKVGLLRSATPCCAFRGHAVRDPLSNESSDAEANRHHASYVSHARPAGNAVDAPGRQHERSNDDDSRFPLRVEQHCLVRHTTFTDDVTKYQLQFSTG